MATYVETLEALEIPTHDDGCAAYCEFREQWEIETQYGTEYVPCDVADIPDCGEDESEDAFYQRVATEFRDYLEPGNPRVTSAERTSRWCAYWSMPGYMDQGSVHCADSESEAIADLLTYDGTNEPLADGVPNWEYDALLRLAELADEGDALAIATMEHNGISLQTAQ